MAKKTNKKSTRVYTDRKISKGPYRGKHLWHDSKGRSFVRVSGKREYIPKIQVKGHGLQPATHLAMGRFKSGPNKGKMAYHTSDFKRVFVMVGSKRKYTGSLAAGKLKPSKKRK